MNPDPEPPPPSTGNSSLLILADGRILAQNVTPALAELLRSLDPQNAELGFRAGDPVL